ncbi:MAG TPA: MEDS domain-containing protein [Longimicrobium sp.]|nr:MEDS domain-containing protein [Longimicrobium sp.]
MSTELESQIADLRQGDHVCLIYETAREQLAASAPFIRDGLDRNEYCIYITDDRTSGEVMDALAAAGIDTGAEIGRGALMVGTKRKAYLRDGTFEPEGMVEFLRELAEAALARGFSGLRITGEMTWALGAETGCDRIVEYEALLNQYFPGSHALAICQYNRERFSADVIYDVLRTHPKAILGEAVCPNLYYEPPELVLGGSSMPHKVEWMVSQLKRARASEQALQEASQEKSNFMATMSHELRTPLNAIIGYADLLDAELAGPLAPGQKDQVERIDANARHLLELIEGILTFSRTEAGQEEVDLRPVDVAALVRETAALFEPLAAAKPLRFSVAAPAGPVEVVTDAGRVRQVLLNLLTNAVKFTDQGEIELAAEAAEDGVAIRVRDTGIGIADEERERIFQPFRQLRAGTTRQAGGTGLGLTVSQRLARLLGGEITVQSVPGAGSTFSLWLPKRRSDGVM